MSRDTKCCDFATLLKMISQISYGWYLQELKSRYYSWLTLWEYARSCTSIFATSTTCEKTTRIELELSHISYMLYLTWVNYKN